MRGPVPKRSDQRRRRNKDGATITKIAGHADPVTAPAEDKSWHISAKRWYRSLKKSGQAVFYEQSDWAYAQLAADLLTMELNSDKPTAATISQVLSMMDNLLTSEGARRRFRVELQRAGQDQESTDEVVSVLDEYRQLLN